MTEQKSPKLTRAQRSQVRRAQFRLGALERKTFPSSSSDAVYTAIVMTDGKLMCDCRGWTIKKAYKPRRCKHTDALLNDRPSRDDGEYMYLNREGT